MTGLWLSVNLGQIQQTSHGDPSRGIPKAALLTAAFFLASSIHVPVPPASVHLVLNGLMGVILGIWTLPAIWVGLLLQAITFGHGGLTTLGLNTLIMGIPAVLAGWVFRQGRRLGGERWLAGLAFTAGAMGLGGAVLLFWGIVLLSLLGTVNAGSERLALQGLVLAHLPLMVLEGLVTAGVVMFLRQVRPGLIP